ncbi:DNA-directed RNA polymerase I subunit RPA43 [Madurella mycetomatis]|uniref:DNA-directed RNA polymerase subunit n=1 Tax=Madurella mycetomatis TaxID=100816 RepID=A0A175VWL9_9PEZI|nr:DNA-directed RNA polymerase I subunit RPA43 [Madurella mycetomatis]
MSAPSAEGSQTATIPSSQRSEKKHKRAKSEHKKRAREEEDDRVVIEETPRKSKKTKSERTDDYSQSVHQSQSHTATVESSKKRTKKHTDYKVDDEKHDPAQALSPVGNGSRKGHKKSSKDKRDPGQTTVDAMEIDAVEGPGVESPSHGPDRKRKEKKSKKQRLQEGEQAAEGSPVANAAEVEGKRKSKDKAKGSSSAEAAPISEEKPTRELTTELAADSDFPFFTQSISLYVPFFPVGFDKPLTNVASQHLDPLLNHYSPLLRGVLLSYSNLNLSDRPAKASIRHPPTDQTPALLHSIDEYAVGFGWLTFDAHVFVPSRGKWMEGVLQLQSEGHIGVVCWNKFNASIEAKRLPSGWRWVDLAKGGAKMNISPPPSQDEKGQQDQESEDMLDGEELQVVEQIHTTGYWVNEHGRKVSGKLRFRIKNFDVGLAGEYGYLSIEGTCLDDDDERALAARDRELEQARRAKQNPSGLLRPFSRRVPEFSMTRFGREDEEEDGRQRTVLYKGSRPGTPDD